MFLRKYQPLMLLAVGMVEKYDMLTKGKYCLFSCFLLQ